MRSSSHLAGVLKGAIAAAFLLAAPAMASDHLDSPTVIQDPRADIGDIFAWMSPDGRRLNLVMAVVGHAFAEDITYAIHIDSARALGERHATATIACRFAGAVASCELDKRDRLSGDVSAPAGRVSQKGQFRVFAGLRDDPFFNNVKGTREAYNVAADAIRGGSIAKDSAGCYVFPKAVSAQILDRWSHTGGGPAQNLLAGWTPASLVISVDLKAVNTGGRFLGVWADASRGGRRIDRMGRPLTGNALLATLDGPEVSNPMKERYNAVTPATSDAFVTEIEKSLGLYDGFDGECGNGLLAELDAGVSRYLPLAALLADDRLWVNSASGECRTLFAVELAALAGRREYADDCGGRSPKYDATDTYRSLLVTGATTGVSDGVDRDDKVHSAADFPFLAAPPASAGSGR